MSGLDVFRAFEVGDGAADFEHAAVGAARSCTLSLTPPYLFAATYAVKPSLLN